MMRARSIRVALVLIAILSAGLSPSARAAAPEQPFAHDRVDESCDRAVSFLVSQQAKDGSISENHQNETTMTSLAIMAMAAVGHQPSDRTTEGQAMRKALAYVLRDDRQDANGYFGNRDGSRMYGHGIITLMLAEMLGMGADEEMDQRVQDRLQRAIALILDAQRYRKQSPVYQGGWRYSPDSGDSDISVSVWQLMALRSAKNAGVKSVPKEAIDQAVGFIRRCYKGDAAARTRPQELSAFSYQPGGQPVYSTAAAGLLSMQVAGQYEAPEVLRTADWLISQDVNFADQWFFYGTYYYSQGMYQRGDKYAQKARQNVEQVLLEHQNKDGSWTGHSQEHHAGRVYATAMSVLSLSVKYHYLPIYQR
jgi:hypothetical protein